MSISDLSGEKSYDMHIILCYLMIHDIKHNVPTTDSQLCTRQWRLHMQEECDRMLVDEVIEAFTFPWLSPVLLAERFCVNYHQLNRLDRVIYKLSGTKLFTVKSVYWTVEVESVDKAKTAFSERFCLFQFCRM